MNLTDAKRSTHDLVILGDINLDWNCPPNLAFPFRELTLNGVIEWTKIDEVPGGSGLNFARFSQEAGYTPLLLGKIGNDPSGEFIHSWLLNRGLHAGVGSDPTYGTGKAFIIRDANDIRFLVNNSPNANRSLSIADVKLFASEIASSRILYVSGYCFMEPNAPRVEATIEAMRIANETSNVRIVFDVVPHQFYRLYDFAQFRTITNSVDILIAEVATMRRFLNLGSKDEKIGREIAEETVTAISKFYKGLVLRFGPSGCDEQVIWNSDGQRLSWDETKHSQIQDKRGYGDQLAIRTLKDVFDLRPLMTKST